jgi:hypothetical protein
MLYDKIESDQNAIRFQTGWTEFGSAKACKRMGLEVSRKKLMSGNI